MSKRTNLATLQPTSQGMEYGNKSYVSDKSYQEQSRTLTASAVTSNAGTFPESEFTQPYDSESYQEMEYEFAWPFDFDFDWELLPLDEIQWMLDNPDSIPYVNVPMDEIFKIGEPYFDENGDLHIPIKTSYPKINDIKIIYDGNSSPIYNFSMLRNDDYDAVGEDWAPSSGGIRIMIKYTDEDGRKKVDTRTLSGGWLSGVLCGEEPEWDYDAGIETIARSSSGTVVVSDGTGPYTWSVSGTGFTLDNATTTGRTNTLNADATACGSATITVTDACEVVVTGYVRCTTGTWTVTTGNTCLLPGVAGTWAEHGLGPLKLDGTAIQGKYKSVVRIGGQASAAGCPAGLTCSSIAWAGGNDCPGYCASQCPDTDTPCTECLTGYSPSGYTQIGSWLCWGEISSICEGGAYSTVWCGCIAIIWNWEWTC